MSVVAVVGVQWGDEGKGKIVELLAGEDALIAQYAGGYSADKASWPRANAWCSTPSRPRR